jgi:hypothetical protein
LTASVLFLLIFCNCSYAGEKERVKLAKKFMVLTDVQQMMEKVFDGVKKAELGKLEKSPYPDKTPENDKVLLERVKSYIDNTLTWRNLEEGYAGVYSSFFTEEELQWLVDFYSSPVAKKLQSSDRELKKKLLESTQIQMKDMALKIKKIENDFIAEQKKEKRHE